VPKARTVSLIYKRMLRGFSHIARNIALQYFPYIWGNIPLNFREKCQLKFEEIFLSDSASFFTDVEKNLYVICVKKGNFEQ
jgi:hypothetical protein